MHTIPVLPAEESSGWRRWTSRRRKTHAFLAVSVSALLMGQCEPKCNPTPAPPPATVVTTPLPTPPPPLAADISTDGVLWDGYETCVDDQGDLVLTSLGTADKMVLEAYGSIRSGADPHWHWIASEDDVSAGDVMTVSGSSITGKIVGTGRILVGVFQIDFPPDGRGGTNQIRSVETFCWFYYGA